MKDTLGSARYKGHSVDVRVNNYSPAREKHMDGFLGHAAFNISIDGIDILLVRGCRVVQRGDGIAVQLPGRKTGGEKKWEPLILWCDESFRRTMMERLTADLRSFLAVKAQAPAEGESV